MEKKARYIGATRDKNPQEAWKHTELWYEYRSKKYCVIKDNNGYMGEPLRSQHEKQQKQIDELLDSSAIQKEWKYEGSAQEGFNLFWEYCESEGEGNE